MNYAWRDSNGYSASEKIPINVDPSHPDYIVVADAQLLFTAQFHRAGPDLVLIGQDGHHYIVPGYFSGEHRPGLVAPTGASLPSYLVDLLAGSPTPGAYAQAQPTTAPSDPIGRVEKVVGDVTVTRNGVAVALNVGDAVYKSDVIQTADHSSVGIAFPDGTALNLVANTRMALNDYSYDAASTSNVALFNLVEGGLSFVAGKVAHTGEMHLGTPVAALGIRGTAGWLYEDPVPVGVTATAGNVTLHFAAVFDQVTNTESTFTLYATDANGNLLQDSAGNSIALATVSSTQTGLVTTLTGNGIGA
ncbi:MAG: FecR family protein, partial [Xanthobacteraceae bacterium]